MAGRLLLLGPQHPSPNLPQALASLDTSGPVAVLSAGWRHDESQLGPLAAAVQRSIVRLPLYDWFDDLATKVPTLVDRYHERQRRIRAFKKAYEIEVRAAMEVQERLEAYGGRYADIQAEEINYARQVVRAIDQRALSRLDEIRAAFPDVATPWQDPVVDEVRTRAQNRLAECPTLLISGGHVAVLLNRLAFFGVDAQVREHHAGGGHIVAWSGGAMLLTQRIVLFYDDPPRGSGDPEVLDHGLGLVPRHVFFPHAATRLHTHDQERVHRLATRFAPARCVTLDNGAWVELVDGALVDHSRPGSACELSLDGLVRPLSPVQAQT